LIREKYGAQRNGALTGEEDSAQSSGAHIAEEDGGSLSGGGDELVIVDGLTQLQVGNSLGPLIRNV
jgi:hypothetical protein